MSPIECIEAGILNRDWEQVCVGYRQITGKSLPSPKSSYSDKATNAIQDINNIINDFYKDLPFPEVIPTKPEKTPQKKPRGRPKKKNKNRSTISSDGKDSSINLDESKKTIVQSQTGGTQLITNEPDPEEVKSNAIKAAKTNRTKLTLKRKPANKYDVECNECEKIFKSDRSKGEIGQKCSECLSKNKSVFT